MNYGVGDEVVCIDAQGTYSKQLVLGKKYVVAHIGKCVALRELAVPWKVSIPCERCGVAEAHLTHFYPWRFIKLSGLTVTESNEVSA